MRRFLSLLIIVHCFVVLFGKSITHNLDAPADELTYHIRIATASAKQTEFSVMWLSGQSDDEIKASITAPPNKQADEMLGGEIFYEIMSCDSLIARGTVFADYASNQDKGISAVLKANSMGATLDIGGSRSAVSIPVPFDMANPQRLTLEADPERKIIRHTLRHSSRPVVRFADFEDLADLKNYIVSSEDKLENFWLYLDRNTDRNLCTPGGKYTLATIADGSGGYNIYYIDGAQHGASGWRPLRLKGHLSPTIFNNHFDLEWYDSFGRVLDDETSADFTTEGTILECRFPLLKSSLRFRAGRELLHQ